MPDPLRPLRPSADRPWNAARAAHLLRRGGFRPTIEEIERSLEQGPEATVARLVRPENDSPRHVELDALGSRLAASGDIERLRAWWIQRMTLTERPLAMRMSVFWHGHFATSQVKVRSAPMMFAQLRTIERHALGRFGDLLLSISQDPAMIAWLDGDQNVKGRPNENVARELFELFALGVGNYTERDVQEAARAFTGWHQRHGVFHFASHAHDDGVKEVLGVRAALNGDDVVRLCLEQPACARFIGAKLLRELVTPQPSDELVEAVAGRLCATGFDMADTVERILLSEALHEHAWTRISSPVELVVGLARSLHLSPPASALSNAVSQMGQRLFEPPSVEGWEGHRAWLNAATMLVRLNTITEATTPGGIGGFDPGAFRAGVQDRERIIERCTAVTLQDAAPTALLESLASLDSGPDDLVRAALSALATSPEYQLV